VGAREGRALAEVVAVATRWRMEGLEGGMRQVEGEMSKWGLGLGLERAELGMGLAAAVEEEEEGIDG